MAYREDTDLEFLENIDREDLYKLARMLTHDKDGSIRFGQSLSDEDINKVDYWKCVAEQIQTYGANTLTTMIRFGKGVEYREILIDVCDKLEVNYNKENPTYKLEQGLLDKILKDSWERMSDSEKEEMLKGVNLPSDKTMLAGAGLTALSTLMATGSLLAFRLTTAVIFSVTGALMPLLGNAALALAIGRGAGWLLGPLGWGLTAISLAGPAYRVTVPVCVMISTLRKKYKLTPEEIIKLKKEETLIKKMHSNLKKYMDDEKKCISLYVYQYKILEGVNALNLSNDLRMVIFGTTNIYENNKDTIMNLINGCSFKASIKAMYSLGYSEEDLKTILDLTLDGRRNEGEKRLREEFYHISKY